MRWWKLAALALASLATLAAVTWAVFWIRPPDPAHLAAAVEELGTRLGDFAAAARARAELFDAQPWLERHRDLFEELVR